ncbi:MAG: ribonuclease Z [Verrucomicrobiaceae bacterium]
MEVFVLGAGTVIPAENRSHAGYLVRGAALDILFDIGAGTISRLFAIGKSYRDIDLIVISHLHADHVLDLISLLQANNATPGWARETRLQILGCKGLKDFVQNILSLFDGTAPEHYLLEIIELEVGRHDFPDFILETAKTGHTSNSLAFRLEMENRIIVYTGDATERDELVFLSRQADVLICECSFLAGFETTDHLTADQCGRLAQRAGVQHLVLTHLYPNTTSVEATAQANSQFDGIVTVARDGSTLDV